MMRQIRIANVEIYLYKGLGVRIILFVTSCNKFKPHLNLNENSNGGKV